MRVLGIESSCDDTAAAVWSQDDGLLANVLSSQDEIHSRYGGVVPELASRRHLENIHPIVFEALGRARLTLADIDLVAATQGPGLIGSLLVGYSYAKALAHRQGLPLVGVDHMAGHLLAIFLQEEVPFPYVALIASGGTSSLFLVRSATDFQHLGRTRDDAAGEAFDKVAKLLELPYPGGPQVAAAARQGDPERFTFPRAWLTEDSLDFSFSGLKTAVLNQVNHFRQSQSKLPTADICASFQEAVVEVLCAKTLAAAERFHVNHVVLGGGVSANQRLRQYFARQCKQQDLALHLPPTQLCTDNAAMIAYAGFHKWQADGPVTVDADVFSRSTLG